MTIRETVEQLLTEAETALKTREDLLAGRELALGNLEAQFRNSDAEVKKKELSLVEWEATLRDRTAALEESTSAFTERAAQLGKERADFNRWRTEEITRLENLQRKVAADENAIKLTKEQAEADKKQQEIIRSKLVSERAALDSAWNEMKYDKLKATT